jgi:hypothetical protein
VVEIARAAPFVPHEVVAMPLIEYEEWNPKGPALLAVAKANEIIAEYEAQGFNLTLRQLYYQFVSRDLIANKQKEYKRLGDIVSKARRAGLIDWDAIVDRTRELRSEPHWDSPEEILAAVAKQYKTNPWDSQDRYVEVWFEKDALMGVFERPANEWRAPFFSCRGYTSDSEVWAAAQRFQRKARKAGGNKRGLILHFGDHDPSGLDMSRDIEDRLRLFGAGGSVVEVKRIALTFDQVQEHNPPPNPAKETDSRFANYQQEYGDESWELDALNPTILAALVAGEVGQVLDRDTWDESMAEEATQREQLEQVSERFEEVAEFLEG